MEKGFEPIVSLVDFTDHPLDLSIAAARTCYSSKGIITPEQMRQTDADRQLRDRLAASTMKAGHLTTRQHAQFVFALDKVSRHFVWSFLHSHPFYNSEQVSQRYVEVKPGNFFIPARLRNSPAGSDIRKTADLYKEITEYSVNLYKELAGILFQPAAEEFCRIFPNRAKHPEKWKSAIHKKSIETARYVLPVSVHTYMYHTVNGLTLHRYAKMMNDPDVPEEAAAVVKQMIAEVRKIDPDFTGEFSAPGAADDFAEIRVLKKINQNPEREFRYSEAPSEQRLKESGDFVKGFDSRISEAGYSYSLLESLPFSTAGLLSRSLHSVTGLPYGTLTEAEALRMILEPAENPHIASHINENIHSRISRILQNAVLVFSKKISHTADSQDQRHRMVPGSRPLLMTQFSGRPDYITPLLIRSHRPALQKYTEGMEAIFSRIREFLDSGGLTEEAVYLLPNAFPVRFTESGDLLSLRHKWSLRLCYNAQEEIFQASLEEVRQLEEREPLLKGFFRAPCYLRKKAGINPPCPEGSRFCGVRVWEKSLDEYKRLL